MKIVPIVSGGLDSTTLIYHLLDRGHTIEDAVSFNYGQRHKKELTFAAKHCDALGIAHHIIDLSQSGLSVVLGASTSSLTNGQVDVPEGHYAADNMKATVVPNRNMMMLAIGGSIAVATGADAVSTAVHAGDHFIYPDCRPEFIHAAGEALALGNDGFGCAHGIFAPFLHRSKAEIAARAIQLDVHLEQTWSCYKGGMYHCGKCGTCVERLEAIDWAEKSLDLPNYDQTQYEDKEYWRKTLAEANN